jgi:hypothetical protein
MFLRDVVRLPAVANYELVAMRDRDLRDRKTDEDS